MKSYTPPELIDEFRSLNGFFPTIQALTEKIRELSTKYKCSFISYSVGPSRLTQIYACSHCKSIYNCKAKAKFSYEDGFARFFECINEHNHQLNKLTRWTHTDDYNATSTDFKSHLISQEKKKTNRPFLY